MAYIRHCVIATVLLCRIICVNAQTVYYPSHSSDLLKSTAADLAQLLQRAIPSAHFNTAEYATIPPSGIILVYDSTVGSNQSCKVESNGTSYLRFTAAEDNGLHFGIYQYLRQAGFRFYQPGSIWEMIPALSSVYRNISTTYSCAYKYKGWSVSGGCNRWAMDTNTNYSWDTYFGENGHNLALYQRRNGMAGEFHFAGHRGDLMNGDYLSSLQQNPCYVACYNGSRTATSQSVPDINNPSAMNLWSSTIEAQYTHIRNIILGNTGLYANYYRNFSYYNQLIGIEVPDGANWGNSKDIGGCSAADYPKESDQNFKLANNTVSRINSVYPGRRFQVYAYAGHADVPSPSVAINPAIDIQFIPEVYQLETSTNGMRNRWYSRYANVSEYHYLNLTGWSGETPLFNWTDLKKTLSIIETKKSQGIMWEASPAKFASLPYLLAANNELTNGIPVDSTLREFCNNMFAGASGTIYQMLMLMGDKETTPDKYKIQVYLQLLHTAIQQTANADSSVRERLRELKAYVHYMVLYFDCSKDDQHKRTRAEKDANLCIFLARSCKMQLVNSYYMIANIANSYPVNSDFYRAYNNGNGTAYQNGQLPLLTSADIDANFSDDLAKYSRQLDQINILKAKECNAGLKGIGLAPVPKVNVSIRYTNGINYYNRATFNFIAGAPGNFSVKYSPRFNMAGKGYINFLVESTDSMLMVVKDLTIDNSNTGGSFTVDLPSAGNYMFTVSSKYQSAAELSITTNGNFFFKNGAFLGNTTESYTLDSTSMPGYFYVPPGMNKVYFLVNNSISSGKYASAEMISNSFNFRDNEGRLVMPHVANPADSSLFYLDVPGNLAGTFLHVTRMEQYNLQFINISNQLWFAQRETVCEGSGFSADIVRLNGKCITRLTAFSKPGQLAWKVNDHGRLMSFGNQLVVDLPEGTSKEISVTLFNGPDCSTTKRTADDQAFIRKYASCSAAFDLGVFNPVVYPNPSDGIFKILQKAADQAANEVLVTNALGELVGIFRDTRQFDISHAAAGIYWYTIRINGVGYRGKIMKR